MLLGMRWKIPFLCYCGWQGIRFRRVCHKHYVAKYKGGHPQPKRNHSWVKIRSPCLQRSALLDYFSIYLKDMCIVECIKILPAVVANKGLLFRRQFLCRF